jgi:hypothetical protein
MYKGYFFIQGLAPDTIALQGRCHSMEYCRHLICRGYGKAEQGQVLGLLDTDRTE